MDIFSHKNYNTVPLWVSRHHFGDTLTSNWILTNVADKGFIKDSYRPVTGFDLAERDICRTTLANGFTWNLSISKRKKLTLQGNSFTHTHLHITPHTHTNTHTHTILPTNYTTTTHPHHTNTQPSPPHIMYLPYTHIHTTNLPLLLITHTLQHITNHYHPHIIRMETIPPHIYITH